mmetsp:Transcript_5311/g.16681  ORF Transcript_5311/g.16681 Transcript_5311/m.16681 type:complete len:226 (+) Transcript_5311:7550-8227(+)
MCFLYSSSVVAPIHCNSPLANAGLSIFAASIAPSAAPAPTNVCTSSITKIISLFTLTSSIIFFKRSSNSPRYFVPATSNPISKVTTLLSSSMSGTSLAIILWANPSAIDVLPTPGSPIRIGLFLVLLPRICITRSISFSRPITGSRVPASAFSVKSVPNSSNVGALFRPWPWLLLPTKTSSVSPKERITCVLNFERKTTPKFSKTLVATPSFSLISPSSKCSVPI